MSLLLEKKVNFNVVSAVISLKRQRMKADSNKEFSEPEWEMEYWNSLSEEEKDVIGKKAQALFNSDKSPLAFMVQSAGSIGYSRL